MHLRSLLFSLFLLVGCGESPLLNHKLEPRFGFGDNLLYNGDHYSFTKSGMSFSMDWAAAPQMGANKFLLKTWKSAEGTINGPYSDPAAQLHIFLWMPSMGHGSSPVKITKLAPGEYEVTDVYFIMGGNWEVKFQLLSGGKVIDEVILPFDI